MKSLVVGTLLLGVAAFRYEYPKEATEGKNANETNGGVTTSTTTSFHFDDSEPTEVTMIEEIDEEIEEDNFTVHVTHTKSHKSQIKPLETKEQPKPDPNVDYSKYDGDEVRERKKKEDEAGEPAVSHHHMIKKTIQAVMCPRKKEVNLVFENGVFFGIFLACAAFAVIRIIENMGTVTTVLLIGGGCFFMFMWYEEEAILGETLFIEEKILGWC